MFKLHIASRKLTILYTFTVGADGRNPGGSMLLDAAGNLYGIAGGGSGYGTVFKLAP